MAAQEVKKLVLAHLSLTLLRCFHGAGDRWGLQHPTEQKPMDFDTPYELKKKKRAKPTYNTSGGYFESPPPRGFTETLCFVYGTLMDSGQLERLLHRKPELKEAKVVGYKTMMAGEYPALLEEPNAVVYGMAFEIKTAEEVETLKIYETDCYKMTACLIRLKDQERKVIGKTFLWEASPDMLCEGSFDLEAWQAKQSRT